MAIFVTIPEAQSRLSELLQAVWSGEGVIVTEAGTPLARLVPFPPRTGRRRPGSAKGQLIIPLP